MADAAIRIFMAEGGSSLKAKAIVAALSEVGVALCTGDTPRKGLAWIVIVDSVTEEILSDIRQVGRGGTERVLVLASEPMNPTWPPDAMWRLLAAGASDVISWTDPPTQASATAEKLERWYQVDELVNAPVVRNNLIGASRAWLNMLREVVEVTCFSDTALLITGESGTGKELVARLVHTLDQRSDKKDLVVVDCTTLARELAGSELFGHEKGAFTGATVSRDGAVALANGGTLFLDEVGELPLPLQAQLLRLVQERTYKRVGGNSWQSSKFRLVSATNRDLAADVTSGTFRGDLYYRLATWVCQTPPLRDRPEDILPLAEHFIGQFLPDGRVELDDSVRQYLLQRAYPGNVRELRQVVQRLCSRHVGKGRLTVGDLAVHERPSLETTNDWQSGWLDPGIRRALNQGAGLREIGRTAEDIAVQIVVMEEQGNLQRAAKRLGVTDRALQLRRAERRC